MWERITEYAFVPFLQIDLLNALEKDGAPDELGKMQFEVVAKSPLTDGKARVYSYDEQ